MKYAAIPIEWTRTIPARHLVYIDSSGDRAIVPRWVARRIARRFRPSTITRSKP